MRGTHFWGHIPAPKMEPPNPKKKTECCKLAGPRLVAQYSGVSANNLLQHLPADAPPSPPALHPLIDHAFVWHTHVQLLAMEGLLPLQKRVHRRRCLTMIRIAVIDPLLCGPSARKACALREAVSSKAVKSGSGVVSNISWIKAAVGTHCCHRISLSKHKPCGESNPC